MHEALFYKQLTDKKVKCLLCPHHCSIRDGDRGICRVRTNMDGVLYSENYEKVCSVRFDPVEKKPFYHFFPGRYILSIGSVGCNLGCRFCQNWEISQTGVGEYPYLKEMTVPEAISKAEARDDSAGLAFTYNEPTVWYEYMLDIARAASEKGLRSTVITNGYINEAPLRQLMEYTHAFNVDLKSYDNDFYTRVTSSRRDPVLSTIKTIAKAGHHLELTHLVITGLNDSEEKFRDLVSWIVDETGIDTPLHISRYFPVYKLENPATSVTTMMKFFEIAKEKLNYVYLGNLLTDDGQNTYCPDCGQKVIERSGYATYRTGLDTKGCCSNCRRCIIRYL